MYICHWILALTFCGHMLCSHFCLKTEKMEKLSCFTLCILALLLVVVDCGHVFVIVLINQSFSLVAVKLSEALIYQFHFHQLTMRTHGVTSAEIQHL